MLKNISLILILMLVFNLTVDPAKAKLVACVGDSITYGLSISNREYNSYPAQLSRLLQKFDIQWQAQNFGVGGATLLRNGDKPYVQQSVYTQALAARPDAVIIMLGTNDSKSWNWVSKDDFVSDYSFLIDSFAELPSKPKIWICNPVPAFSDKFGISNTVIKDEIIPLISQVAALKGVEVIDLHTALSNTSALFPDGIHPNAEGAKLIAEAIFPISTPDFNGDGIVDAADICLIIDHWGENYSLFDVGPAPFGDDIIDVQDLIVLSEYLFTYPGAVAYWKLDEETGETARNSINGNDDLVMGDPIWQPAGGMIDGALEFDGIDDYVSTNSVLNPADGVFSVLAWINGGAPGQVILSQIAGANWLSIDPSEGKLMTSLSHFPGGRIPPPSLISEFVITDGKWHRIGFVWDGTHRTLYVDSVVVAEDIQNGLAGTNNGFYIGCGKSRESDSFFSGLIDDVRIYNRVVSP